MVKYSRRIALMALACAMGTMAGIRTAQPQQLVCHFIPGAGYSKADMSGCYDAGDCGYGLCCLRHTCVGHLPNCGANCGQQCAIASCDTIDACYADCT